MRTSVDLYDAVTVPSDVSGAVRTADLSAVRSLVKVHGYAIVRGHKCDTAAAASALAEGIWEADLLAAPEACEVRDGAVGDDGLRDEDPGGRLLGPHSDGFAYGDHLPDYFLLACHTASEAGGENYIVDGLKVLEHIDSDPATRWAADALRSRKIDQTELAKRPSISSIVQQTPAGRVMLRHLPFLQQPWAQSDDVTRDAEMISIFHEATAIVAAGPDTPWLKLEAGEALVLDNYRMFHGRAPYKNSDRLLWRQWVWTAESKDGKPSGRGGLPLHSDSRFADEAFLELSEAQQAELATLSLDELRKKHEDNRVGAEIGHRNAIPGRTGASL